MSSLSSSWSTSSLEIDEEEPAIHQQDSPFLEQQQQQQQEEEEEQEQDQVVVPTNRLWSHILLTLLCLIISLSILSWFISNLLLTTSAAYQEQQQQQQQQPNNNVVEFLSHFNDDDADSLSLLNIKELEESSVSSSMSSSSNNKEEKEKLKKDLTEFLLKYNPDKVKTVNEALEKLNFDVDKVNERLRSKYGVDLVSFPVKKEEEEKMPLKDVVDAFASSSLSLSSSSDDDEEEDDSNNNKDTIISEQKDTSLVRVIVVGALETGLDVLRTFLDETQGFSVTTEEENLQRLMRALVPEWDSHDPDSNHLGIPYFDVFSDRECIVGSGSSTFFEELMVTYPRAMVVIAVRNVDAWYTAVKRKVEKEIQPELRAKCATREACPRSMLAKRLALESVLGVDVSLPVTEFLWKRGYHLFYERVLAMVPRDQRILIATHANGDPDKWKRFGNALTRHRSSGGDKNNKKKTTFISSLFGSWHVARPVESDPIVPCENVVDALASMHAVSWLVPLPLDSSLSKPTIVGPKVYVVGLDGTGFENVLHALEKIGLSVTTSWEDHFERKYACTKGDKSGCETAFGLKRVLTGEFPSPDFTTVFRHVDVVGGIPGASFVKEEVLVGKQQALFVFTHRASSWDDWWKACSLKLRTTAARRLHPALAASMAMVYGGARDSPYLLRRKIQEHADLVARVVPPDQLLILDPSSPDASNRLCMFLTQHNIRCTTSSHLLSKELSKCSLLL